MKIKNITLSILSIAVISLMMAFSFPEEPKKFKAEFTQAEAEELINTLNAAANTIYESNTPVKQGTVLINGLNKQVKNLQDQFVKQIDTAKKK